jgi:hypothetical protein
VKQAVFVSHAQLDREICCASSLPAGRFKHTSAQVILIRHPTTMRIDGELAQNNVTSECALFFAIF